MTAFSGGVNAPVGSRRELVANCVHTADADATQLDSCIASAVCIGHKRTSLFSVCTVAIGDRAGCNGVYRHGSIV